MSKRGAGSQVTRERGFSDSDSDEPQAAQMVSSEVMSRRKIAKPRSKFAAQGGAVKQPASGFSFPTTAAASDQSSKLKALNLSFQEKINSAVTANGLVDLTPIVDKYGAYFKQISTGTAAPVATPVAAPVAAPVTAPVSFGFGQPKAELPPANEEKKGAFAGISVPTKQGAFASISVPKAAPAAPTPAATATASANSDSDSDSEEEIKIQGPSFSFSATAEAPKNSAFVFGEKLEKRIARQKKEEEDYSEDEIVEVKGPSFTFGGVVKDSTFKLDNKDAKPMNFGTAAATEKKDDAPKPAFSFGSATEKKDEAPKPAFSFGSTTEKKDDAPKPAFSFGSTTEKKDEAPKPAFSFGSTTEKKDEAPKPAFSFGSATEKKDEAPKPAFSFGSATEKKDEAPKPSFTFTAPNKEAEKKDEKPSFTFGTSKPSFTFSAPTGETPKPQFAFDFNKKPEPSTFSFGTPSTFEFAKQAESESKPAESEDKVEEEESTASFAPVVKLGESVTVTTGEEEEDTLCTYRAKLLLLADGKYDSKGLGEIKILQHKTTNKARIVIRSDGANRVLLNAAVVKNFTYASLGKDNAVKLPVLQDGKVETYVVRVKNDADGRNIVNVLNKAKESC